MISNFSFCHIYKGQNAIILIFVIWFVGNLAYTCNMLTYDPQYFFGLNFRKYALSFSSQFNSGLKSGKARTSRGRNNIVYRVHFLGAFCGFKKFTSFKMQPTFRAFRSTGDFVRFPNCKSWTEWESGYNICWICSIADHKYKLEKSPRANFLKPFQAQAARYIAELSFRCFSLLTLQ